MQYFRRESQEGEPCDFGDEPPHPSERRSAFVHPPRQVGRESDLGALLHPSAKRDVGEVSPGESLVTEGAGHPGVCRRIRGEPPHPSERRSAFVHPPRQVGRESDFSPTEREAIADGFVLIGNICH